MSSADFWQQTPRTFLGIVEVKADVSRRDQQSRAWLAYMTATLGRVKKMPKFKDVLPSQKKGPAAPTPWEKQLAVAQQWASALRS